jgi:hypothetical protein
VVGLALAVVPCCPITALVGALLGAFALRALRPMTPADPAAHPAAPPDPVLAQARGRVRRIALVAIAVGGASAILSSGMLDWFLQRQQAAGEAAMLDAIATVLTAAADGRPDAALDAWSVTDADRPDADAVTAFGRAAVDRFGPFERFSIISSHQSGPMLARRIELAGVFHFERASPIGSIRFEMRTTGLRLVPDFRPTRVLIEDRDAGDLVLGATGR